jgi:RNA methyltransferase, TrmH family
VASRVPHEKVYGVAAAWAVLTGRNDDVLRIAYGQGLRRDLAPFLRDAAARRLPFEERSDEDLAKIAGSVHHEGICLAVRPRRVLGVDALLAPGAFEALVALDDVGNPHNVGAIVRSAAFFGVDTVLVAGPADRAPMSPAAVRVAQGGAEHVRVARADGVAGALRRLAEEGVAVVGADVRGGTALPAFRWPRRVAIVLGHEGEGMREEVRRACTDLVFIPGTGAVESLNVSVAAGVMLASWAASRAAAAREPARPPRGGPQGRRGGR